MAANTNRSCRATLSKLNKISQALTGHLDKCSFPVPNPIATEKNEHSMICKFNVIGESKCLMGY